MNPVKKRKPETKKTDGKENLGQSRTKDKKIRSNPDPG
jgi:hypothetical protein